MLDSKLLEKGAKVEEIHKKFIELNNKHNAFLDKKNSNKPNKGKKLAYTKKAIFYFVLEILIFSGYFGFLHILNSLVRSGVISLTADLLIFLGTLTITDVGISIVRKKRDKELDKIKEEKIEDIDYNELCNVRKQYLELKEELDLELKKLSEEEYQEYLSLVYEYARTYCTSTPEDVIEEKIEENDVKTLDLKNNS